MISAADDGKTGGGHDRAGPNVGRSLVVGNVRVRRCHVAVSFARRVAAGTEGQLLPRWPALPLPRVSIHAAARAPPPSRASFSGDLAL